MDINLLLGFPWTLVDFSFLAWGARGRRFESSHADQMNQRVTAQKAVARFPFWGWGKKLTTVLLDPRPPFQRCKFQ